MHGRVWRKTGQYALVLWVALTLNFALPHLAPGDPVAYLYGGEAGSLSASQLAEIRASYGLDRSLHEQYGSYLWGLGHGDLGMSIRHNRPVTAVLAERIPWTLLLVVPATVIAATVATLLGAAAAWRRGSRRETALVGGILAMDAMPAFWVGMVLVAVFAVQLGWLPSFGAVAAGGSGMGPAWDVAGHLVLPVLTLTMATLGGVFLLARAATLSTLAEPYVLLAEAKGASLRRVRYRHALRNALLPVATNVGLSLGTLLSGAVVVETVFAYPGLGRLLYAAVIARDYPLLQGTFLLITVGVVGANLLADLAYPLLDPRVRRPPRRHALIGDTAGSEAPS